MGDGGYAGCLAGRAASRLGGGRGGEGEGGGGGGICGVPFRQSHIVAVGGDGGAGRCLAGRAHQGRLLIQSLADA